MARHGFGRGEYKYFPTRCRRCCKRCARRCIRAWRPSPTAGTNCSAIRNGFPPRDAFLAQCHAAGQKRPTPLILQYGAGDYNCLHQDLYGERVFPLQVAILLSRPGRDFSGGEFVMTETASSGQRAEVIALDQGDALLFTVNHRPAPGKRGGTRKVAMRHGVSRVLGGSRHTVGLIFHDAR